MQPEFHTERLRLRPIADGDASLLFELDSDPEVMRYLSGGAGTPLALIEAEILPRFLSYPGRAAWGGVWIAFTRASGEFVGWFSLRPQEDLSLGPDLGYRLKRAVWGEGLATEGSRALLEFAFRYEGVKRVSANTYEFNAASRRVMEKLGMRHLRSYRFEEESGEPGTFIPGGEAEPWDGDEVEYAISREEWLRR